MNEAGTVFAEEPQQTAADRRYDDCGSEVDFCGPDTCRPSSLSGEGREIPSFFILWINVVRFKPSVAAAPFAPPITQLTASSVWRISVRSESRSVVAGGGSE